MAGAATTRQAQAQAMGSRKPSRCVCSVRKKPIRSPVLSGRYRGTAETVNGASLLLTLLAEVQGHALPALIGACEPLLERGCGRRLNGQPETRLCHLAGTPSGCPQAHM